MRTVLRGGDVFDASGSAPASGDVVIEDGRIVAVGAGLDGDDEIDCGGRTVLPGFIDSHVHFMADGDLDPLSPVRTPFSMNFFLAAERMARTLAAGVTTVREAGGSDLGVKEAQASGLVPGPSMLISITILSQTGGHGDSWEVCGAGMPTLLTEHPGRPSNVVDGAEEMRRKVRELVRAGADVIKVCTSGGVLSPRDDPRHGHFRDDELDVLVAEATAAGRWVMSHAQATDGIKSAVRAGIRSIEHGIYLDDEAIEMMLDRGTYLVPTLVAPMGVLEAADRGVNVPQYAIDKTKLVMESHRDSIARAIAAGVKVAMGTDSGVVPHGENLRELEQMTLCGMSPTDALVASTRTAAELLGVLDDRGTIEPGKRADLVVLDGDPLAMSGLGDRVNTVIQDGRLVTTR
ncbi:MAG TPA: amidohydrolase family protein [Ilumatobacter sp.]|jgi:imidazolonepropionase-like amidohydrolase|nr:amidohydrolase family protein [Ilumatobacter sp.]